MQNCRVKNQLLKHFKNEDDMTFCNVLFIFANSPFSLTSILSKISKGKGIIG
jgi:hypothetical protein